MNVAQLREALAMLPDDAEVLVAVDHHKHSTVTVDLKPKALFYEGQVFLFQGPDPRKMAKPSIHRARTR